MFDFDLENVRLEQISLADGEAPPEAKPPIPPKPPKPPKCGRQWMDGGFIRGPLPLTWFARVCGLGGSQVFGVALALWHLAGIRGTHTDLKLTTGALAKLGVHTRDAKYRALKKLEDARLINVTRRNGKNPLVTILGADGNLAASNLHTAA